MIRYGHPPAAPRPPYVRSVSRSVADLALAMRELAESGQPVDMEALYLRGFSRDDIAAYQNRARERARLDRVRDLDGQSIGGQP